MRTPIGRYGGALASVRPDDLAALVIRCLVDRTRIDPALIEDVILGCANQAGEDNRSVARMAALLAGLPVEVAGQTVNRLCGSGLQAINSAAQAIWADEGDVFIAGGVESMTRAPYVMLKPEAGLERGEHELVDTTLGWRFVNPKLAAMHHPYSMGETAENVADRWSVDRARQDAFAAESQRRAVASDRGGPVRHAARPGDRALGEGGGDRRDARRASTGRDDGRGAGEAQARLPRRRVGHGREQLGHQRRCVGGAAGGGGSGARAGAAADGARRGHRRRGRGSGGHGHRAGAGDAESAARAGLSVDDLDVVELNEAFASQSVACIDELGLDPGKGQLRTAARSPSGTRWA